MVRQRRNQTTPENEIIVISSFIGVKSESLYSGIGRMSFGEPEYREGEVVWNVNLDASDFMARMRDLPSAIQQLDEHKSKYVRGRVLQEYANWKMLNDCYQLPGDLAVLIRLTIFEAEFEERLWNAYIGL